MWWQFGFSTLKLVAGCCLTPVSLHSSLPQADLDLVTPSVPVGDEERDWLLAEAEAIKTIAQVGMGTRRADNSLGHHFWFAGVRNDE